MKRLLLLSNSTNFGEPFLQYPIRTIQQFLGPAVSEVLFVPYAGVRLSFSDYAARVRERFREIGIAVTSVHETENPAAAVEKQTRSWWAAVTRFAFSTAFTITDWWSESVNGCCKVSRMWAGAQDRMWRVPRSGPPTICRSWNHRV